MHSQRQNGTGTHLSEVAVPAGKVSIISVSTTSTCMQHRSLQVHTMYGNGTEVVIINADPTELRAVKEACPGRRGELNGLHFRG